LADEKIHKDLTRAIYAARELDDYGIESATQQFIHILIPDVASENRVVQAAIGIEAKFSRIVQNEPPVLQGGRIRGDPTVCLYRENSEVDAASAPSACLRVRRQVRTLGASGANGYRRLIALLKRRAESSGVSLAVKWP
jgi:hypothetical protein